MMRKECSVLPLGCWVASKASPGDRCNWLTMTRSAPLMTKVPWGVMSGSSPMKTFSSLAAFSSLSRKVTYSGAP